MLIQIIYFYHKIMPNYTIVNDPLTLLLQDLDQQQVPALSDFEKKALETLAKPNRDNRNKMSDLDLLFSCVSKEQIIKIFKIKVQRIERLHALLDQCLAPLVDQLGNPTLNYYFELTQIVELLYKGDGVGKLYSLQYVLTQAYPLDKKIIDLLSEAGFEQDSIIKLLTYRHGIDNINQLTHLLVGWWINKKESNLGQIEAAGFPQDEVLSLCNTLQEAKPLLQALMDLILNLTSKELQDLEEAGYGRLRILEQLKSGNGIQKINTLVELYRSPNLSIKYLTYVGFNLKQIMHMVMNNSVRDNIGTLTRLLSRKIPSEALTPFQRLNNIGFGANTVYRALSHTGGWINLDMFLNYIDSNVTRQIDNQEIADLIGIGFELPQIAKVLFRRGGKNNIIALHELTQLNLKQSWIPSIFYLANGSLSSSKIKALFKLLCIKPIYDEFWEQPKALPAICTVLAIKPSSELDELHIQNLEDLVKFFKANYNPRPKKVDTTLSKRVEKFTWHNETFEAPHPTFPQKEPRSHQVGHKRNFTEHRSSNLKNSNLFSQQLALSVVHNHERIRNKQTIEEFEPFSSARISELISSTFPVKVSSIRSEMAGSYKSSYIAASFAFFPSSYNSFESEVNDNAKRPASKNTYPN